MEFFEELDAELIKTKNKMFFYYDKNGREINLSQTKKTQEYHAYHPSTNSYFYQTKGVDPQKPQEDACAMDIITGFSALSQDEQTQYLKTTFSQLEHCNGLINSGSTAIVCLISKNKIVTAHVGDSLAYIVVTDKHRNIIKLSRLNKELHNCDNEAEKVRVVRDGGRFRKKPGVGMRVSGDSWLAVTRSIGDDAYKGVSHEPDIYFDEIEIPEGGSAFVLLASDGLAEGKEDDVAHVKILLEGEVPDKAEDDDSKLIKDLPLKEIPAALVKQALKYSYDNITVAVMPLNMQNTKEKDATQMVAGFDAHGDAAVAEASARDFGTFLQDNINLRQPDLTETERELFSAWDEYVAEFCKHFNTLDKYPPQELLQTLIKVSRDRTCSLSEKEQKQKIQQYRKLKEQIIQYVNSNESGAVISLRSSGSNSSSPRDMSPRNNASPRGFWQRMRDNFSGLSSSGESNLSSSSSASTSSALNTGIPSDSSSGTKLDSPR
jgi:serine/threonine protein phosphatase PrpC